MNRQPAHSFPGNRELLDLDPRGKPAQWMLRLRAFVRGTRVLLWGVALVVIFVSLPLLRSVALKENEMDAMRALRLLGGEVFAEGSSTDDFRLLLEPGSKLGRRLPDTRLVDGGRLMFHHGYLFEIVRDESGTRELRAWPLVHGKSGLGAFWYGPNGGLLGHPNGDARWSGIDDGPSGADDQAPAGTDGWRSLRITPNQRLAGI